MIVAVGGLSLDQSRWIKVFGNYSAYLLFCPIAALKVLIYTCKLRAFALLLNKIEGNLSSSGHAE